MMRRYGSILIVLIANPLWAGVGDVVAAARADAEKLPKEIAYKTVYLSLAGYDARDREELRLVVFAHCNRLSRESVISKPREVTPELLAVNLDDYQWTAEMFNNLLLNEVDPYFRVVLEKTVATPATINANGQQVPAHEKKQRVQAVAPWANPTEHAKLIEVTKLAVPLVRADWFVVKTSLAPRYYEFLGLGNKEADFQKLVGADPVAAKRLKKEMAAVVGRSGVTLNNRGMIRLQSITGAYWTTQDYRTSKDKQNALRLLDGATVPPNGDASEQIGSLPNGLLAYWLQNDKGERQNEAPPDIASDGESHNNDRRVIAGGSCVRCHNGWKDINDWARNLYQGNNKLVSPDYQKLLRLKQLYLSDLKGQLAEDQAAYAKAIKQCNGLSPAADAKAYANVWSRYDADMTIDDVARELECTVPVLIAALKAQPLGDPVMMSLLPVGGADEVGPPAPGSMLRPHFEEAVPLFHVMLGKKP